MAAVHFELAVDQFIRDGFELEASPCPPLAEVTDDNGFALAFAAVVGGARGALIREQALVPESEESTNREVGKYFTDDTSTINFYSLLKDNLLLIPDGSAWHAYVDGHDWVTLVDGLGTSPGMSQKLLGFEPMADPWRIDVLARHRLRGILADEPLMRKLASLRVRTWAGTQGLDAVLHEFEAAHRLTHLCLWTERNDIVEAPVRERYPGLRSLECGADEVRRLLADGAPQLHSLTVRGYADQRGPVLPLLAGVHLPALRHLFLWDTADEFLSIEHSPLINQLTTLDLSRSNTDLHMLLYYRSALTHLEKIVVSDSGSASVLSLFQDWPEVTFTQHDRREILALDLNTRGRIDLM
ncbi:hypothetical protein ACIHFC_36795 [Streptomyces sp. NPDC052013]|uniref:hypothetical protein n=1 Tax=Streptomyces sp. NPDC052013 TaxID=3365679 RepID=UPI0037D1175C